MVQGEISIPKRSTEQEAVIENYEMMVATLEDPNRAAQKTCKLQLQQQVCESASIWPWHPHLT